MSRYLNFYTNDSGHPMYRPTILRLLESDACEMPEGPCVEAVAIFDTSTTPPTLVKRHQWLTDYSKWDNAAWPEFFIDSVTGNIVRACDNKSVMEGPKQ